MRRIVARAGLAAAALALTLGPLPARGGEGAPWYEPDHAKLQLAGNVGFLSPGAGYAWGRRLEGDVFLGWVPEAVGGADIFSVTAKLRVAPWSIARRPWTFRPFTAAFQVTYTFGDQYFVIPPFRFIPTALRSGLALGAEVVRASGRRTLGVYAEAVALDLGLGYWLANRDALGPQDVFSLAVGVRLGF